MAQHSAEGVEAVTPTKLDTMMTSVERYVRQFGRISRKQLDPVVSLLDKEGSISLSNSLSLLRLYGSMLFDEPPANRLKLADELWEKFKKHGITLDVMHYNTLLAVYNMNKLKFSPTEFLASMEANGVTPNRITYQRLIARFCEEGDIQGATQVLEHMKTAALPINDHVFNSFITGHLRCNDPDSARNIVEVMRQTGLEPTGATYTVLAVGFAERGEIEEVKKFISQAEIENVHLRPGQLLDVYVALATSGHSQHLAEVFPFLHNGTPFNQDAIRVCNQLIAAGYDDAAYQLFLEMPKPSRLDVDQTTLGRFFLRALAKHERPVDKVLTMVKDMQDREVNKDDLSAVTQLAYLEGQPAYALTVLEKMKAEGLPVRAHYFWPAMCQFRNSKNKEGIYDVMKKMMALCDTRDDFIQTLHGYTIPALLAVGETDIISNLQKCDFEVKDVQFAYFLTLLEQLKVKEAIDFLEKHEVTVYMASVRACLASLIGRYQDWRPILQILNMLKTQSGVWRPPALDCTALVLKQILVKQRKDGWVDVQDDFNFMVDNDLKILKRSQEHLTELFKDAPADVLQRLEDVVSKDRAVAATEEPVEFLVPADMSLKDLKSLAEQKPNNKTVLKRLMIKACAVGDTEEAERVHSLLEGEGFVFPPVMLAQLAYLYATFVKDLPKASAYLQQLEETFPEHENYQTVVLKMAALHAGAGDIDAAVDRLKSFAEKHRNVVERQDMKREENYSDILNSAPDVDAAKRLMGTLTDCGYLPSNNSLLLDTYMDRVVSSGDAEQILQEFEEIAKTHKRSPQVDKVLQFFIRKEDADSLQKVVDLLTSVHGLMNVLHHLIADFIECGHVKKARKIMETAGLRANMQRLNYYCQSFIERNMIQELEMLVEVTKDMFAVDRDNMLFHLMRGYVKQDDMDKAKDVLMKYEEEMIQPSARTLRFLARSLERAGLPVPFDVPDFQPPVNTQKEGRMRTTGVKEAKTATQDKVVTQTAALEVKDSLEKGEVEQVLTTLQSSDKGLLGQAIKEMKKPWPSAALQSLFDSLVQQGEVDILMSINENVLPLNLKNRLKAHVFTAAVNSGRGEEVIDRMEGVTTNMAKFITFPALDTLSANAPHLMDRLESLCRKVQSEKKYTEPLSVLWCYYKYRDSPQADQIMKETPGFNKTVLTGALCQTALKENKVDVLESVLKMKQDVGEKQGMAVVYSSLLQLYVEQNDVEAVEKTCQRIVGEGLLRSNLRTNPVTRVEDFLKENNKPLPAWGDDSSSDSSSSSSDEERR